MSQLTHKVCPHCMGVDGHHSMTCRLAHRNNPTRREIKQLAFMRVAGIIAELGTCDRKQVGTVIVLDGRCVSWGFNGAPPGLPHCDENNHGWGIECLAGRKYKNSLGEWRDVIEDGFYISGNENGPNHILKRLSQHSGCLNATHAEANALAAAARQGISTDGGSLFTTCSPCDTCSRLIIAAGIIHVYYLEEYRDRSGVELLLAAGITCEQL